MEKTWMGPGGFRSSDEPRNGWDREFPGGERQDALSGASTRQAPGTSLLQVPEPKMVGRMNVIGL
jgi:hypothetical protein